MNDLLILIAGTLVIALLIWLGLRRLFPGGVQALEQASRTNQQRAWPLARIGRSKPPKTGDTIWLAPSPQWERRRRRTMAIWRTRWLWGGALIIALIGLWVYTLLQAQQWWSPLLAALFLPWWCSVFLRDARPNAEAASMQLGVQDHTILLRDRQGEVTQFTPEELGFDGIHLTTPQYRIRLTRRANLRDAAANNSARIGLFEHSKLLESVLPLLADSPTSVEPTETQKRWLDKLGASAFLAWFVLSFFYPMP